MVKVRSKYVLSVLPYDKVMLKVHTSGSTSLSLFLHLDQFENNETFN